MYKIKQFLIFLTIFFSVHAHASPFSGRDYSKCQDFYIVHSAKILEVLPAGDGVNNLYIVDMPEPYFSWSNLVLRIRNNDPQWANLSVGDVVPVKMIHTTSDVVVVNPYIEEGFFHSIIGVDGLSYFGFLRKNVETIRSIQLDRGVGDSEVGPYVFYTLHLTFSSGEELLMPSDYIENIDGVASVGDQVLISDAFLMKDHIYQPNPFGTKKVYQKHRTGAYSTVPLYMRPEYASALFNLTRGTAVTPQQAKSIRSTL